MASQQGEVLRNNVYKVILIGAVGVGKTSLLVRYVHNNFEDSTMRAISEEKKTLTIGGQEIVLDLWDTAGQERYRSITERFYHNTSAIIIVFDVTDGNTYEEATENWLKDAINYLNLDHPGTPDIPIVLVGNKIDNDEERVINMKELKQFKRSRPSLLIAECSAKTGNKVDKIFEMVAREIIKSGVHPKQSSGKNINGPNVRPVTNNCC